MGKIKALRVRRAGELPIHEVVVDMKREVVNQEVDSD